jgi:hypothetical protein
MENMSHRSCHNASISQFPFDAVPGWLNRFCVLFRRYDRRTRQFCSQRLPSIHRENEDDGSSEFHQKLYAGQLRKIPLTIMLRFLQISTMVVVRIVVLALYPPICKMGAMV